MMHQILQKVFPNETACQLPMTIGTDKENLDEKDPGQSLILTTSLGIANVQQYCHSTAVR